VDIILLESPSWLLPIFILLTNNWLVFHFLSESDLLRILRSPWLFRKEVLMLKIWRPRFNQLLENFRKHSFWMLLPDFPLEYWSIRVFEEIANSVGKFMFFYELVLQRHNTKTVCLLVELDLDRGLSDSIDITIGEDHFSQMVDFWKEPFHCHSFWKTRHLQKRCFPLFVRPQCSSPLAMADASSPSLILSPADTDTFFR
jgi:hypothetical protein